MSEASRTVVHRPAPLLFVYGSMVLLALIGVPPMFLAPPSLAKMLPGVVVFFAFELLLLSIARRHTLLTIDASRKTLTLQSVRWPLSSRARELPRADVLAVKKQRSERGGAVRLVLVTRTGEVPVTSSYFGDSRRMDDDATAIRDLCGLAPVVS